VTTEDRARVRLTPSQENYLEWIYRTWQSGRPVRVGDLATKLGVKLPSVSRAISQLAKSGLVRHDAYGLIELTESGQAAGRAIVRRDECLTRLLVDVLGMTPEQADPEVHRLEHVLDDDVLHRLEVLVDFATSSEAWIRRLQHRIRLHTETAEGSPEVSVGATSMHAGLSSEQH